MAWIDETYLQNLIGSGTVTALGLSTAGVFAQFEGSARSRVLAVIQYAGYPSPGSDLTSADSDAANFLKACVASVMVREAMGMRKGIQLPETAQAVINATLLQLDAVYEKRLPVPGMTPNSLGGYGGFKLTPSSGSSGVPQVWQRGKLRGF